MNAHLDDELSALIDGELEGAELERVQTHLSACAECREALEDLRRLVRRAGALDDRPPEKDLWAGIASRIVSEPTADVIPLESRRRRVSFSVPQLAAAALALMALSFGASRLLTTRGDVPVAVAGPSAEPTPSVVSRVNERVGRAVSSYESAIGELEQALEQRRGTLDTATVRVLEQSLGLIDSAIAQARSALERDPGNVYLNGTLQRALDRKLGVLRQVTLTTAS